MIPKRVYLSGGGICAIAHVAALQELQKHISLRTVKEWMGVSAGALLALCLVIGFSLDELRDFCIRFDFTNITEHDSIPGWILHFGIDTGDRLQKLIEACLHVKGLKSSCTFEECYKKNNRKLRVVASDLNDGCAKEFSVEGTPDYRIADAVRASMSFPYYFQPFICPQTGHYLADGGIISNYPLFLLSQEERSQTISLLIKSNVEIEDSLDMEVLFARPIRMILISRADIESRFYDSKCIKIPLGNINILEFALNDEIKNMLLEKGQEAVAEYFKKHCPRPVRRYSVS